MSGGEPVAVITGAGGGLGIVLVEAFLEAGWRVAAVFHRVPPPEKPAPHLAISIDVADPASVDAGFGEIARVFGRIDLLVNNAGVTADDALFRMTEESWDRVLSVNLRGAFLCSRAVVPGMVGRRDGAIINVASFSGRVGAAGQANYSAAKAGLFGLTQSLAAELGPPGRGGLRVNAVLPGVLDTPMTRALSPRQLEDLIGANALQRMNSPGEVARFMVFLAGSRNISGQLFQLDSRIAPWA
jgi:3-oxoacyl-[acyl-carrier protein] reductase